MSKNISMEEWRAELERLERESRLHTDKTLENGWHTVEELAQAWRVGIGKVYSLLRVAEAHGQLEEATRPMPTRNRRVDQKKVFRLKEAK